MQEYEQSYLEDFIRQALSEDVGDGDHSSNCCVPESAKGKVQLIIKAKGVLAGMQEALKVFELVDPGIEVHQLKQDGERVVPGDIALQLRGPVNKLLQGERLALNILQRMSGIASKTRSLVDIIEGTGANLLDTRKTTPNLRPMEKRAVRLGGGVNHRMGLYDMIMLKDNHVDFAGGIEQAIDAAHRYQKEKILSIPVEIETRSLEEVKQVLEHGGVQRIMFDNFSVDDTRRAVEMVNGKFETEASGGIDRDTLRPYAETGVNFISVGALTHSYNSMDMSLKAYDSD